jgi:hypothetical protein
MAYTKSPTQDTHNVVRLPVEGESFLVSDNGVLGPSWNGTPPKSLAYIDCFLLPEKQGNAQPKLRAATRESWTVTAATSTTAITGGFLGSVVVAANEQQQLYFFVGNNLYNIDYSTATPYTVTTITTGTSGYLMGITGCINSSNTACFATIDNISSLKTWNQSGINLTTTNLAAIGVTGYRNVVFMNGYLFAATKDKIYNSGAAGALTTWSSTDFIAAEQWSDEIRWLEIHKNYLVAFGQYTTEFFYDAAVEVGSPLARQESYAQKIGLVRSTRNKNTAIIGDDIYFIGRTQTDSYTLYRLRDFKMTPLTDQFVDGILNTHSTSTNTNDLYSIEVVNINNNPMVAVTMMIGESGVYKYVTFVYNPLTESYWQLSTAGTPNTVNTDFPAPNLMIGSMFFLETNTINQPRFLSVATDSGTQIFIGREETEGTRATNLTSYIYTDVIDLGTNRYKHLARIDAIGDYGNNTLTLSYNGTPKYSSTYTDCSPTYSAATIGYGNNISWYNLGAYRRFSLKLKIYGISTAFHEGFDLEYNMGVA